MTTIHKLAQALAVVAFGTAANAQEAKYSDVEDNTLNGCITETLKTEEGALTSYRMEDGDRIRDAFYVNASPAADQGHTIGTQIVLDGTKAEGMTEMQFRGIHDGTVENDGGASAIDYVITANPQNIAEPADAIMVSGNKPWSEPLVDPKTVEDKTIQHLNNIRACVKRGGPAGP